MFILKIFYAIVVKCYSRIRLVQFGLGVELESVKTSQQPKGGKRGNPFLFPAILVQRQKEEDTHKLLRSLACCLQSYLIDVLHIESELVSEGKIKDGNSKITEESFLLRRLRRRSDHPSPLPFGSAP